MPDGSIIAHSRRLVLGSSMSTPNGKRVQRYDLHCPPYTDLTLASSDNSDNVDQAIKLRRYVCPDKETRDLTTTTFNDIANLVSPLDKTKICEVETSQVDGMPALVAQWYPNGNVVRYLDENPEVDKVDLSIKMAEALLYLHEQKIAHGNFCPGNVLIDDGGNPRISDVHLHFRMLLLNTQDRIQLPHSWVYKSPQELNGGRSPPRMSNDVFSFGSTLYEVLTGKSPCHRGPNGKWLQMRSIINHEQPFLPRPPQISPALWGIIQKCWVSEPQDRATMAEVVTKLRDLVVHEQ